MSGRRTVAKRRADGARSQERCKNQDRHLEFMTRCSGVHFQALMPIIAYPATSPSRSFLNNDSTSAWQISSECWVAQARLCIGLLADSQT